MLWLAPVPSVLLVHCDDAGEAAGPSSASSGLKHLTSEQENEESPLFPQECVRVSLWAAELCPSPCGTGPSSSRVLCNSRALS